MRNCLVPILAMVALLAATPSVSAADGLAEAATLRVDRGQVMVSDGGPFVTAETGNVLQPGSRVMLTGDAGATLFFDDKCSQPLAGSGVYVVARECVAPTGMQAARQVKWGTVALVVGGVGLAAALASGGGGGNDKPPPVSR